MTVMVSNAQLDRLGRAIRDDTMTGADRALLVEMRTVWRDERQWLEHLVRGACTNPTVKVSGRVKNIGTLREKLRRMNGGLSTIRDVVGVRAVVDGTREDHIFTLYEVTMAVAEFSPKLIDRMSDPRSGYRALHLEIRHAGVRSEIQVRSKLQHEWAETMERFADKAGRDVRYVENYDFPHLTGPTRELAVSCLAALKEWSTVIDAYEYRRNLGFPRLIHEEAEARCKSLLEEFNASL